MDFEQINEELFGQAQHLQTAYYKKVVPGSKKSLGVKVPVLRKLAKSIARGDYRLFLEQYPCEYLEQDTLKALVLGYAKDELPALLAAADAFIPQIKDWMVNDAFCQNFSIARKHRPEVYEWLQKYIETDEEYPQRVAAVLLMSHFLVDEYYERVLEVMNRLKHPGYYTKMGVAWCVATAFAKYPQATMHFMRDNQLDDWTYNKAIQKMRESYRVSDADKKILLEMKRNGGGQ
ncbi:MAG: DNA alkylation repair protein [Lachnospiraceae bacterium]|nr:DNA alkylation repair protein [Lachnospiraceae bacterium]